MNITVVRDKIISEKYQLNLKYIVGFIFLMLISISETKSQEILKSGSLSPLQFTFTGPSQYSKNPTLVHALAYANAMEIRDLKATQTYSVNYKVIKIPEKGFETILSIRLQKPDGNFTFYQFEEPDLVLPKLSSLKLVFKSNNEYIYVKEISGIDSTDGNFYFTFKHQRFAKDWNIILRDLVWLPVFSEDYLKNKWNWINDYETATLWLKNEAELKSNFSSPLTILYKQKWLEILNEMSTLAFYQNLILEENKDPLDLKRKLEIRKFVLSREIEQLRSQEGIVLDSLSARDIASAYFQSDLDKLEIAQRNVSLYSDLYFEFDAKKESSFCLTELNELFSRFAIPDEIRYDFEMLYQKMNLDLISRLIAEKLPNEALFQVERFEAFYKHASYLEKSATFQHFKAKAVYDIYLSYIQVARQAIEKNRIEMASEYLDQASQIQQKYPAEIINDIYVEKELRNLIQKALERYQKLIDNGEHHSAEQMKKGILGLMKKLGLNESVSGFNNG